MIQEPLHITNRFGEKLEALLRKPGEAGTFPAVLFVPGFGMDLHEYANSFDEIASRLVQEGFCTLQFSFAGCGRSEGDYVDMSLNRQADQVDDVVSWFQDTSIVRDGRIGVVAQSFGVPSVLSSTLQHVSTLVLISGAYTPYESMRVVFAEDRGITIDEQGITHLRRSSGATMTVGPAFWSGIKLFDMKKAAKQISAPTLVIHGDLDAKISTEDVQAFYQAVSGKKRLKVYRGGDHGVKDVPRKTRDEFLDDIVDWVKEVL